MPPGAHGRAPSGRAAHLFHRRTAGRARWRWSPGSTGHAQCRGRALPRAGGPASDGLGDRHRAAGTRCGCAAAPSTRTSVSRWPPAPRHLPAGAWCPARSSPRYRPLRPCRARSPRTPPRSSTRRWRCTPPATRRSAVRCTRPWTPWCWPRTSGSCARRTAAPGRTCGGRPSWRSPERPAGSCGCTSSTCSRPSRRTPPSWMSGCRRGACTESRTAGMSSGTSCSCCRS